jgi:DNA-binding XRE family transcriptional regulator
MKHKRRRSRSLTYSVLELGSVRYAVLPARALLDVCRAAGVHAVAQPVTTETADAGVEAETLPERLIQRRLACGLSQAELARRAGVRVETLNRIERGRTTPDFATVRKLVLAMKAAEAARDRKAFVAPAANHRASRPGKLTSMPGKSKRLTKERA